LHRAISKYGKNNFSIEILATCDSIEAMNYVEEFYIRNLNTLVPSGYNLRSGGNNSLHSASTKRKIAKKAKNRRVSQEHRDNISKGHMGKRHTEETKRKIGAANKIANLGHKHSAATKRKVSLSRMGNKNAKKY
jgi:group I intron endonuclease